eukprot:3000143-Pyramimonas_sp.AAC.1
MAYRFLPFVDGNFDDADAADDEEDGDGGAAGPAPEAEPTAEPRQDKGDPRTANVDAAKWA